MAERSGLFSSLLGKRSRDDGSEQRPGESNEDYSERMNANITASLETIKDMEVQIQEAIDRRSKDEAVPWDSVYTDGQGRVGTGDHPEMGGYGVVGRTPWLCSAFPMLRGDASFEGHPALRVEYGGRGFSSAAAAFQYAKAAYFDARLGSRDEFGHAFEDPPAGATPLGDALPATIGPAAAEQAGTKGAMSQTIKDALGGTKAKAGKLHDQILQSWYDDEADVAAMRAVLASKFSDANAPYRDLLLATGDKELYEQRGKKSKELKIWDLGGVEPGVSTSGLGLYGDLLMERRDALRA